MPAVAEWVVGPTNVMRYEIELKNSEPTCTAVIRGRVRPEELPRFVPAACGEVWSFIRSASLPRPGRHLALYLDGQGSVEVGAEVSEPFTGNDRVHCSRLPAGRVATAIHFGPTHAFPRRMQLSAHGALNVGTDARLFLGKSMGT